METKPFKISKYLVLEAFKLIKANKGTYGIDEVTLESFEQNLRGNLYKIWNRLSSGSYFPPAVRGVEIPKKNGKIRLLGIPTVADRIAQMTIKLKFEPIVERKFLPNSFGYRKGKSALQAIELTRKRCWSKDWILEFDIVGLFDNLDHKLLMKAVKHHTNCKWTILYIERWIKSDLICKSTNHPTFLNFLPMAYSKVIINHTEVCYGTIDS